MFWTDPSSASIWSQVSLLLMPILRRTLSKVGFLRMNVPFADCSVNTFAAQGSMPALTLPLSLELDTVGAIARRWVLRTPKPRHHRGSPNILAISRLARSDSSLMWEKIRRVSICACSPSNGAPRCCR